MKDWMITVRKPYAKLIMKRIKDIELRKKVPRKLDIGDRIYIVEGRSKGLIVASTIVVGIECGKPEKIWRKYNVALCMPHAAFNKYVNGCETVCAIKLKLYQNFTRQRYINEFGVVRPPQWFVNCEL